MTLFPSFQFGAVALERLLIEIEDAAIARAAAAIVGIRPGRQVWTGSVVGGGGHEIPGGIAI